MAIENLTSKAELEAFIAQRFPQVLAPTSSPGFSSGDLKFAAYDTPDDGWLLCDGSAISRTVYSALFTRLGTTFGAGDGSTTFNVPDYRGRAIYGKGTHTQVDSLADNDGLAVGSRRAKHAHSMLGHTHTYSGDVLGSVGSGPTVTPSAAPSGADYSGTTSGPSDSDTGDTGGAYGVANVFIKV